MTQTKKTFVNRGKHAIKPQNMYPDFVYAVEYDLSREQSEMTSRAIHQIGLVRTNSVGSILCSWNVAKDNEWADGAVSLEGCTIWPGSQMELQFVNQYLDLRRQERKIEHLDTRLSIATTILKAYDESRLHRFCNWLIRMFS